MKQAVIIGAILATLTAMAGGLWIFGRPVYRKHREATAATQAAEFLVARKYSEASLSARRALAYNPTNVEACMVMARLAEMAQAPVLLDYRRRIAQAAPTLTNKLALAVAAMLTQSPPYPMATQTLEELAPGATNSVEYHAVAAQLALRLNHTEEALAHFQEANRLKPESEELRLNMAVMNLASTNESVATAARQTLESMRSSTNVAALALRWLVADRINHKEFESAERISNDLLGNQGCVFEDRLTHLRILEAVKAPALAASLAEVQTRASTNGGQILMTTAWMLDHNLAEEASQWLSNCPPKVRSEPAVSRALAECFVARKDWAGLEEFLQSEKWGEMDFVRFAFLSRAAEQQKQSMGVQTRWRSAVREAGDRLGALIVLLRMSTLWGRQEGTEELLWAIVQRFPTERWTLFELERTYVKTGNTKGLYRVWSAMAGYNSKDFAVRNNVASTALLLGINLPKAHAQALEVFKEHPENPVVASTYAFSLHLQGKHAAALTTMEAISPEELLRQPVSLYYGIVLAAAGQHDKASKYLKACKEGELLPEERTLLAEALSAKN